MFHCKLLFVLLLVPSNYGYLSEGSILRLLFDFLDKAGKTGLLTYNLVFVPCFEIAFLFSIVNCGQDFVMDAALSVCLTMGGIYKRYDITCSFCPS